MRFSSQRMTLMYSARSGTSSPISFSTAMQIASSQFRFAHVVEPVEQSNDLAVLLALAELFRPTVQISDVRFRLDYPSHRQPRLRAGIRHELMGC